MKLLAKYLMVFLLLACDSKSVSKIGPTITPTNEEKIAVLQSYEPLAGAYSHVPYVRHFMYKETQGGKFTYIHFINQTCNVSSWFEFIATPLGKNLLGGLFQNGGLWNSDLYLWFVLQSAPSTTLEYKLELYHYGNEFRGYETVKMGVMPETKIKITYAKSMW